MAWRSAMKSNIPKGVDMLNSNYTHPHLVMVPDLHALPLDIVTHFCFALMGEGRLFSGRQPTQWQAAVDDERHLFVRPYAQWAPPPYSAVRVRADSGMNRAMAAFSGMGDLLSIVTTTSSECDRDLHHAKTRLLHGAPPVSAARWRRKRLHEPAQLARACQHVGAVVDAFEYLNLPQTQSRMRGACNGVWMACSHFQRALNAYRRERGRAPVCVTALWEEYVVDFFGTVEARAHAWTMARVDELREAQIRRLRDAPPAPEGTLVTEAQMEILDRVYDLTEITNKADTKIMLPLQGYILQTLTAALPRVREDWDGYTGGEPMTQFPTDMRLRAQVYAQRCSFLTRVEAMNSPPIEDPVGDPKTLEDTCRVQIRAYDRARAELRGPAPELGDEPWIGRVKEAMEPSRRRPARVWGFVGYRVCYGHSDEEWRTFLERFKTDVTAWGEGVGGAASVKPTCKVRWIDGREHGIPEGDIEAARRHYREYSKSPALEGFLAPQEDVFLAADSASIESYLSPAEDNAEPIIPIGDMGSFILAVRAGEGENGDRPRGRGADAEDAGFDGTLRVLGAVLFDDFWALTYRGAFRLAHLAKMAEVHPRQVYVGPTAPLERAGWRMTGTWTLTALKTFNRWADNLFGSPRRS